MAKNRAHTDNELMMCTDLASQIYALASKAGMDPLEQPDSEVEAHPNQLWFRAPDGGWMRVEVEYRERRRPLRHDPRKATV